MEKCDPGKVRQIHKRGTCHQKIRSQRIELRLQGWINNRDVALGGILGQFAENEFRVALSSIHRIRDRPLKFSDVQNGRTPNRLSQFVLGQATELDDSRQVVSSSLRWHKLLGCSLNEFPLARSSSLLLVGQTFQIGPRQHERVVADGVLRPLAAFTDGVKAITQVSGDFSNCTQFLQQSGGSLLAAVEGADEMMSRFPNGQSLGYVKKFV